jgi:predicted Zn-dependent protease
MRINYMEAPKDFLMSNGKMVASFHDLDFLESNSNENTRIHLYPM